MNRRGIRWNFLAYAVTVSASLVTTSVAQQPESSDDPFGHKKEKVAADPFGAGGSASTADPFGNAAKPTKSAAKVEVHPDSVNVADPPKTRPSVTVSGSDEKASRNNIEKALRTKVSLEFSETPLSEVAAFLQDSCQIPILIDRRALDDIGVSGQTPVTISVQSISLQSALRLALSELDLTYSIHNSVLSITTRDVAEDRLEIRLYPVADVMARFSNPSLFNDGQAGVLNPLADVIVTSIAPDSWDAVGGAGSIVPVAEWGLLTISQTVDIHERIESLLSTMRRVSSELGGNDKELDADKIPVSTVVADANEQSAIARMEDALDQDVVFEFSETPLSEVLQFIQQKSEIPTLIDRRALDAVGLGSDTPITVSLKGIPLRSALELLLEDIELTFVVNNELLQVTTPDVAEGKQQCRVYPVADLMVAEKVPAMSHRSQCGKELSKLSDVICASVAPDTWDSVGGSGTIQPIEPLGVMVVSQSYQIHREVENLIRVIREARAKGSHQAAVEETGYGADKEETVVRIYPIRAETSPVQEIVAAIEGIVDAKSWMGEAEVKPVGNLLVVRQTVAAHELIYELLDSLQVLGSPPPGNRGMAGGMF